MMEHRLDVMMSRLPEREQWRMLQNAIDLRLDWRDETVTRLDARMQGLLFLQDHVRNRRARIAFARDSGNMPFLRDAAGSRNVWMSDAEFDGLVEENDAETLACFARCEAMQPHHLLYIAHRLEAGPHRQPELATAYDARITLQKVLEAKGPTRELGLLRLARAALGGPAGAAGISPQIQRRVFRAVVNGADEPRALWRAYLNLASLDEHVLAEVLEASLGSSDRPLRTSPRRGAPVH